MSRSDQTRPFNDSFLQGELHLSDGVTVNIHVATVPNGGKAVHQVGLQRFRSEKGFIGSAKTPKFRSHLWPTGDMNMTVDQSGHHRSIRQVDSHRIFRRCDSSSHLLNDPIFNKNFSGTDELIGHSVP